MTTTRMGIVLAVGAVFGIAGTAHAQQYYEGEPVHRHGYDYDYYEVEDDHEMMGMSLTVGGGVSGFITDDARDVTDTGGAWDVRLTFGTDSIISGEIAYIGAAYDLDVAGLDDDAMLLSNGAEAALRLNFVPGDIQPYILAGVGWQHFSVVNEDFNRANVRDSDDVIHFPLGVGIAFDAEPLVIDVRGLVRPTADNDILGRDDDEALHTWTGLARVGFEF